MSNFLLLGLCLLAGILLKYTKRLPRETPEVLKGIIFYISLPAMVFAQFHKVSFGIESLFPVLSAWLVFLLAASFLIFCAKRVDLDRKTLGALILTAGLGNTSFVGFPMIEAFYGKGGLSTGILVDQLGSFPVISTLGIICASYYSSRDCSLKKLISKIFAFPPTFALLAAFATRSVAFPDALTTVFNRLADTLTPLALLSVGFQLNVNTKVMQRNGLKLFLGLLFKLFLAPLVLTFLYLKGVQGSPNEVFQITILEAAMAPMITSAIVAAEYELDTEVANLMVGLGIPLSLITVPIWAAFLKTL